MYYPQQPLDGRSLLQSGAFRVDGNIMTVSGNGELTVQPDEAKVTLGVITEKGKLQEAQLENSQLLSTVILALKNSGIPQDHIQTADYRAEMEYDYIEGKQIFRGYKITHLLEVKLSDITKLGAIVDAAVKGGANSVSNIRFTSSQEEQLYLKVLSLAVMNALQKAQALGNTLNVKINPTPLSVMEGREEQKPVVFQNSAFVKGASTTQILPGQITIKAVITAKFSYY